MPYFRAAYLELYKYTFADLEKQWDQAVQRKPREGETAEQVARAQAARADGDNDFLPEIDIEIAVNAEPEPNAIPPELHAEIAAELGNLPPAQPAAPEEAQAVPGNNDPQAAPPVAQVQEPNGGQPAVVQGDNWEFRQNISTTQIARTVIGALFFPAAASLMGDLLAFTLPKSWTSVSPFPLKSTFPSSPTFGASSVTSWFDVAKNAITETFTGRGVSEAAKGVKGAVNGMGEKGMKAVGKGEATGLLQEKWGRSLVGGMMFVVLKDALILYVKWKRARDQGKRRVLDYDRRKDKARRPPQGVVNGSGNGNAEVR